MTMNNVVFSGAIFLEDSMSVKKLPQYQQYGFKKHSTACLGKAQVTLMLILMLQQRCYVQSYTHAFSNYQYLHSDYFVRITRYLGSRASPRMFHACSLSSGYG